MPKPNFESVADTCLDIANYAIMLKLCIQNEWVAEPRDTKMNFNKEVSGMIDLFGKKLADYGTADILELGAAGVQSRMTDKFARLKNLLQAEGQTDLLVQTTGKENLHLPKKQGDVGYDLVGLEDVVIPAHTQVAVDVATGVQVKVPDNTWGLIINRSSTPRKKGLIVMAGVIDAGYTGPLFSCVFNTTDAPIEVKAGERLAQLILIPAVVRPVTAVDKLPDTERGATGFGSTS